METGVTLSVYPDNEDYSYDVIVCRDELAIVYVEPNLDHGVRMSFGSIQEMEAVAKAMLRAVKLSGDA